MLRTLDGLRRLALATRDMDAGIVRDVLFDDHGWAIRYVAADAGQWMFGKRVLIAPEALGEPEADRIPVRMTLDELRTQPEVGEDPPSRLREVALRRHHGWPAYWEDALRDEGVPVRREADGTLTTGQDAGTPDPTQEAASLFGARELEGAAIAGADGAPAGTLADVAVDLDARTVAAWVVARPDGTRALVPTALTRSLDRVGRRLVLAEDAAALAARPPARIAPDGAAG